LQSSTALSTLQAAPISPPLGGSSTHNPELGSQWRVPPQSSSPAHKGMQTPRLLNNMARKSSGMNTLKGMHA
jgi:hypothetical protein